jgi:hypothetical protein
METSELMIKNYINKFEDLDILSEDLLGKGIYSKNYPDEGLMLIYTKYESTVKNQATLPFLFTNKSLVDSTSENKEDINKLKLECRSLIIDTEKKEIVSYSCNTPICNFEAINYLLKESQNESNVIEKFKCYEGTLLSLFNHNGKWRVSTRRNLDSSKSVCNQVSYYELFIDIIGDIDSFVSKLDENYCYYFVLIHHLNKNVVNYTSKFGEDYKKLCLAFVRRKCDLSEIDLLSEDSKQYLGNILESENIFLAEKVTDQTPESNKSMSMCDDEGIIIKIKNENNMSYFLKIQTTSYQFNKAIGSDKNIFKGFLNLYQNNDLVSYLENNENLVSFKKIVNPLNTQESYDTIGVIDSVFKVCTSELYELFKMMWDIKTGKQTDTELYSYLPKEYKTILYNIRGIYFKKKHESMTNVNIDSNTHKGLQIKDIYQYLKKSIDTDKFEQFLRSRKLMYNWLKVDSSNVSLQKFSKVNIRCDKVHMKLTAIFTNKLFPNIMPDDIPEPKVSSLTKVD